MRKARAEEIYRNCIADLSLELLQFDQVVGEARSQGGERFETWARQDAFLLAVDILRKTSRGGEWEMKSRDESLDWKGKGKEKGKGKYRQIDGERPEEGDFSFRRRQGEEFADERDDKKNRRVLRLEDAEAPHCVVYSRVDNVEWIEKKGAHIGEVDVAVVQVSVKTRLPVRVVALIEIKAHCFEIALGWQQQARHLHSHDRMLRITEDIVLPCGPSVPVFVVSTIPPNDFVLGAPQKLMQKLGSFFGAEFRGASPVMLPHELSETELTYIGEELRREFGVGKGTAPCDFIRDHRESVFIVI